MSWEHLKQQVRDGKAEYQTGRTTVPGVITFEATLPIMGIPLGFIWYRFGSGSEMEICYIWVHEDMRRCGLATKMFNALLNSYAPGIFKVVSTGQVNEMSKPWCLKNGFTHDEERDYWVRVLALEQTTTKPKSKRAKSRA
jgi:GNAT superfamily N-acetyltransferase